MILKKTNIYIIILLAIFIVSCNKDKIISTSVNFVDPFICTGGHGHTYPGATVPFGMLQVSPDNGISEWDWCSGYHYSDSITIGFIRLHVGNEKFTDKLEQLFIESSEIIGDNISNDISGLVGQYAHGNEPSHHIAHMFNHAKKPWHTQYWVREILKTQYNISSSGFSGNEDCGQMSAWYVFSSMGLYPFNPVSGKYQIGSPIFDEVTIKVSETKNFVIKASNVSNKNIYTQSATLNGEEFNRTFITHNELMNEGMLHFIMGENPNKSWGI